MDPTCPHCNLTPSLSEKVKKERNPGGQHIHYDGAALLRVQDPARTPGNTRTRRASWYCCETCAERSFGSAFDPRANRLERSAPRVQG